MRNPRAGASLLGSDGMAGKIQTQEACSEALPNYTHLSFRDPANTLILAILAIFNSEYSLEALMLKPKLQYFGHLTAKSRLTGEDLDAGRD